MIHKYKIKALWICMEVSAPQKNPLGYHIIIFKCLSVDAVGIKCSILKAVVVRYYLEEKVRGTPFLFVVFIGIFLLLFFFGGGGPYQKQFKV